MHLFCQASDHLTIQFHMTLNITLFQLFQHYDKLELFECTKSTKIYTFQTLIDICFLYHSMTCS